MGKKDARKLEAAAQYELHKQVIRAWKRGRNRVQVSEEVGLSYVVVCNIVKRYRESEGQSIQCLNPSRRDRRVSKNRALTEEKEAHIQRLICEKRPEAVQEWLDEQYPEIEQRAESEYTEIHWGNETAVVYNDVRGRSYAPAGQTPVTFAVGGTCQKLSMIATVTSQGKTRWMIIDESFNSDRLIKFLQALIKSAGKKVFLILDNLRVHHSKPVKA